jgi:hypothetical protein
MTKSMVRNHDLLTGEITEREMNTEELAQVEADAQAQAALDAEQAAKDAARQTVLDKLGLSADEVQALLG